MKSELIGSKALWQKEKIELKEGEVICNKCNGKGTKDGIWLCDKCSGEGKVDWVNNAIKREFHMSSLRLLNIRKAVNYIRKIGETCLNELSVKESEKIIIDHLEKLSLNRVIDEYMVSSENYYLKDGLTIFLKPMRTVEMIRLDFQVIDNENKKK